MNKPSEAQTNYYNSLVRTGYALNRDHCNACDEAGWATEMTVIAINRLTQEGNLTMKHMSAAINALKGMSAIKNHSKHN